MRACMCTSLKLNRELLQYTPMMTVAISMRPDLRPDLKILGADLAVGWTHIW